MEPFRRVEGVVAPLDRPNVDTDQIIPKQFLKRIERSGFGPFLFYDWRFDAEGRERAEFELNEPDARGATILLTGPNFGCGSSREHAPWALEEYGFRVIIAPSFADIFFGNCCQIGLLPVQLRETEVQELSRRQTVNRRTELTVDLEQQIVADDADFVARFHLAPYRREMMLRGLDEIGRTLLEAERIAQYERGRGLRPA